MTVDVCKNMQLNQYKKLEKQKMSKQEREKKGMNYMTLNKTLTNMSYS